MAEKDRNLEDIDSDEVSQDSEVSEQEVENEVELTESDELLIKVEEYKSKAEENWNKLLRTKAELENIRKRSIRDVEQAHKYAIEKIVTDLVPIKESLDLGYAASLEKGADIQKIREGTDLTIKMFEKLFGKFKILELNPVGEKFNPECHQAMTMQPSDEHPANTVLFVVQKGCSLNGRVIKPAMVVVSKGPDIKVEPEKKVEPVDEVGSDEDEQENRDQPSIDERA